MQRATSVVEPGMAEASAATTIYAYDGHNVYSSGGACLRHARPHRSVGCLRKMWVTGRLYTSTMGISSIVVAALASAMLVLLYLERDIPMLFRWVGVSLVF